MFLTLGRECSSAIEIPIAGEIGPTDAEGATAPETLRHKNRTGYDTLERGAQARPPTG